MPNSSQRPEPPKSRPAADWMLVVDDDEPIGELFGLALRSDVLDVVYVQSGEAALQAVAARDREPLLVITDVLMPGMDGLTLARKLSARLKRSKIVVMSGHLSAESPWPEDLREIVFLAKPVRLHELTGLVAAVQAEARGQL